MVRTMEEILQGEDPELFTMKVKLDFKEWCERVMQDDTDHSKGLDIEPFHLEWINAIRDHKRSVIFAPRGHGKTQLLAVAYPLWLCFNNMFKEILIVSNSLDQSTKVLGRIKNTIYDNELLQNLIPKDPELKIWSRTEITTSTRCKIFCKPYNENVRGVHVDYAICDEASLYNDHTIFTSAITPTVNNKDGSLMVIGTPMSAIDLMSKLSVNSEYWSKTYKAVQDDGTPLWEGKFPMAKLDSIKRENPISFEREYLCNPIVSEACLYPMEMLVSCFDDNIELSSPTTSNQIYIGCDFALSSGPSGDYTVITVVEQMEDGKSRILDIDRMKGMSTQAIEDRIKAAYNRYNPVKVVIDASTFGSTFLQSLRQQYLPIDGVVFTPQNRNDLLINLRNLIENERLVIPRGTSNPKTQTLTDILVTELVGFTEGRTPTQNVTYISASAHDDTVMSLALACKYTAQTRKFIDFVAI